jgi:uncharacterized RDD family membrane protein YckC
LNETVLWLAYLASALTAFLLVVKLGRRIVPSILAGAFISLVAWGLLYLFTAEDLRPSFWRVDLSLSVSFAVIFAGAGAAIGFAVRGRQAR